MLLVVKGKQVELILFESEDEQTNRSSSRRVASFISRICFACSRYISLPRLKAIRTEIAIEPTKTKAGPNLSAHFTTFITY
jgi:hypothetical protein